LLIYVIFLGLASSSVAAVKQRNTQALKHLAEEFNLTYTAFGSLISPEGASSSGALNLTEAWSAPWEPAPETPTDEDSAPWQLFGGTVKATYNAQRGLQGDDNIFVSPGVLTANFGRPLSLVCCEHGFDVHGARNTDSRHYWDLTRHIYRYGHLDAVSLAGQPNNIHTVNESKFGCPSELGSQVLTSSTDIRADNFVEIIRFYTTLILNADESREI